MRNWISIIVLNLCCLASFAGTAFNQESSKNKDTCLSSIPFEDCRTFFASLEKAVNLQRERDWELLFELSTSSLVSDRATAREEFIKNRLPALEGLIFEGFYPDTDVLIVEGRWQVIGCAKYVENGKLTFSEAHITAVIREDRWYFSEVSSLAPIDGSAKKCSVRRVKKIFEKYNKQRAKV